MLRNKITLESRFVRFLRTVDLTCKIENSIFSLPWSPRRFVHDSNCVQDMPLLVDVGTHLQAGNEVARIDLNASRFFHRKVVRLGPGKSQGINKFKESVLETGSLFSYRLETIFTRLLLLTVDTNRVSTSPEKVLIF